MSKLWIPKRKGGKSSTGGCTKGVETAGIVGME